jgi:hypothetical protein
VVWLTEKPNCAACVCISLPMIVPLPTPDGPHTTTGRGALPALAVPVSFPLAPPAAPSAAPSSPAAPSTLLICRCVARRPARTPLAHASVSPAAVSCT